jgi:hypothetical protein
VALPMRLARYQSLLDFLVEAALRELDQEQGNSEAAAGSRTTAVPMPAPAQVLDDSERAL